MRYLIVIVMEEGGIHTLAKDYDLERSKHLADKLQVDTPYQIKVLEQTKHGYRIAYISKVHSMSNLPPETKQ
jgi:hypothetical protein